MNYRVFQYAIPAPPELDDLNAWISSQRVVSVKQHLVEQDGSAMLIFVVQTIKSSDPAKGSSGSPRSRVDYKQILDSDTFARYTKLRDERKKIGTEEGVPLYTVFTNEQLAGMAEKPELSEWKKIDGIGSARLEKYGERLLAVLENNETS